MNHIDIFFIVVYASVDLRVLFYFSNIHSFTFDQFPDSSISIVCQVIGWFMNAMNRFWFSRQNGSQRPPLLSFLPVWATSNRLSFFLPLAFMRCACVWAVLAFIDRLCLALSPFLFRSIDFQSVWSLTLSLSLCLFSLFFYFHSAFPAAPLPTIRILVRFST